MSNVTVIIPVHEINDSILEYLKQSLSSVDRQISDMPKLLIITNSKCVDDINKLLGDSESLNNINGTVIINDGDTGYQSQVNIAVQSVDTEYFSVLEFDDEYTDRYFKNIEEHIKHYPDMSIFMPIIIETDRENRPQRFTNENLWAQNSQPEGGELGTLSWDTMKDTSYFNLSGAVIKTEDFIDMGGYKTKIELTFMLEYLYRIIHNGYKVSTINRLGYKHLIDRENSMFHTYAITIKEYERDFWFQTAMKEYMFTNDRDIDTSYLDSKKEELVANNA